MPLVIVFKEGQYLNIKKQISEIKQNILLELETTRFVVLPFDRCEENRYNQYDISLRNMFYIKALTTVT